MRCVNGRCNASQGVLGTLLLLGGMLWLLVVLGVVQTTRLWSYWPAVFAVLGMFKLMSRRGGLVAGLSWIAVSLLLLDVTAGLFGYELVKAAPVLLILAGATLLWRSRRRPTTEPASSEPDPETGEDLSFVAVFGNAERTVSSSRFRSGDVTAIFGGCDLDFHAAHIEGEAELNVFACFGGVTVLVPETWTVVSHGVAILGSFDIDTEQTLQDDDVGPEEIPSGPRLIVRGTTILGGVSVSNRDSWWRQKRQHREVMRQRALERAQK